MMVINMHWELSRLFNINNELRDTTEELSDYETAFEEMYESYERYPEIRFAFDEWTTNEDGETIERSLDECKVFYEKMWNKLYRMLIKKTFTQLFYDPEGERKKSYELGYIAGIEAAGKVSDNEIL